MASEVQDCNSPEANCLPTGSISFGRFESESLTWERRSSFSHNRYLEEVEKYSTPGSVIKKKAYFEAHFKKTALRNLDSFARQNENDGQAENDMEGQDNCVKEFRDNGNEELRFEDFEDQEIQFSWYDEASDVSDEEHESMKTEKQNEAFPSVEVANSNDDAHGPVSKTNLEQVQHDETVSSLPGCDMTEKVKDGEDMTVEEKSESTRENVNAKKMDASIKSSVVRKIHASNLKKASKVSHMAKSTTEQKSRKVRSGRSAPADQMKRNISPENICISAGLSSDKDCNKVEKGNPVRLKQPSSKISSSTYSAPQKSEDSDKMKVKARTERRSDKGEKTKGVLVPSTTSHHQGQLNVHKLANRDKRVTSTMKLNIKNSDAVFGFKSEERAEKRKEYFMKLDEKHYTKEAEMNEIQARKQEETEVAMKQFRKSLNFKATPMPSFYQGACPKVPDQQKAIRGPTNTKLVKMQMQHTTTGSRSAARSNSPSLCKSSNSRRPPTSEHPSTTHPESLLAKSGGDNSHPTEINGAGKSAADMASKQTSQPDMKIDAGKREDRTKSNVQQQQGGSKIQKKGGVNNVRRSSMGKVIKGIAAETMVVRVAS